MSTVPASAHCSRVFSVHSSLSPRRNTVCACPLASGRHRLVLFLLSYSHSEVFCSPSYPASSRCSSGQKPSLAELPPSSQTSSPNDGSSEWNILYSVPGARHRSQVQCTLPLHCSIRTTVISVKSYLPNQISSAGRSVFAFCAENNITKIYLLWKQLYFSQWKYTHFKL